MTEISRPLGKFVKIAKLELADDTTLMLWQHLVKLDRLLLRQGSTFMILVPKGAMFYASVASDEALRWASRAFRYAKKYKAKDPEQIGTMAYDNPDGLA